MSPQELSSLKLPELRQIAQDSGLRGVSALRKAALIEAIINHTGGTAAQPAAQAAPAAPAAQEAGRTEDSPVVQRRGRRIARRVAVSSPGTQPAADTAQAVAPASLAADEQSEAPARENSGATSGSEEYPSRSAARRARRNRARQQRRMDAGRGESRGDNHTNPNSDRAAEAVAEDAAVIAKAAEAYAEEQVEQDKLDRDDRRAMVERRQMRAGIRARRAERNQRMDEGRDGRDNRDSREDRRMRRDDRYRAGEVELEGEMITVGGILDIVDGTTAFLRTTGYHASQSDVFVSPQLIRRYGLRRGDAVMGQLRANAQTNRRQKFVPLAKVDTINGFTPEEIRDRPKFGDLTPLYPNQRLRLETNPQVITTRVIDLIMPIGKGQRALIVSPPKAGKTTILQNIANAITTNNPECVLMVVLVDERPEEVTDMQRNVNGEIIASTFDRPPAEHTAVAELAIERAKRQVEQGHDVVVLLDSITRLGRAYNNSTPASGRILSGGVDSNALYPPKRFLGAARNIENGGSLTIIATAMVETGSAGDTVIFEEFKGTGNAELKLDRRISERRIFPAVDVNPSGTRRDDLLLSPEEARVLQKLRRILSGLEPIQAIEVLLKQLKKTKSNAEFLMQIMNSAPIEDVEIEEDFS